jgi:uncharacterized protein YjbI with pentapeptide repeats
MANMRHLARLSQGVAVWNRWRVAHRDVIPDFRSADLDGKDLKNADLTHASFFKGNLNGANLHGALLSNAYFYWAGLSHADLSYADLVAANFGAADLTGANLTRATLTKVIFSEANLRGADFAGARIGLTVFGDNDLSGVKGLESVTHSFPSTIGIDTVYESKGTIPEVFLRGCGVPESLIAFTHSLAYKPLGFYSCFMSHSAKDKPFCERLYVSLQARGLRVWLFSEDAKWGETVWGEIDRTIKMYDKLIVVCSENSLQSGPVIREIERALNREDKEGKNILFPIRIDDYIFDHWEHGRKADVVRKVVGDFSGWDKDAAKYEKAFERLLKGLQAESARV